MDKLFKIANLFVATLRSAYLIHQFNHWTCKSQNFYELHLLFERIYKSAQENADLAAEKFIGVLGLESVDYEEQSKLISEVLERYKKIDSDPVALSLAIEKDFLNFAREVYEIFETEGAMTLGLDDMIMSIASDREESCYLLKQIS